MLNDLGLVDEGGVGADHSGTQPGFGSQRAVRLRVALCALRVRHLGAVGLAVLVVRMLLTGRTPETFVHFILIIRQRRVVAALRRVLMTLGDAP